MANAQTVEILKVGHALVAGTRGENGGAPSKDSIWGVARIQGNLVKFYGRRGGVLRYKTARKVDLELVLAQYDSKLAGTDGKGIQYVDLTAEAREQLVPGLADFIKKGYYKAMGTGKLNNRDTRKASKPTTKSGLMLAAATSLGVEVVNASVTALTASDVVGFPRSN